MEWVDDEPVWFFFPALGDVFERSKAFEGLQALAVVVGVDEGGEVFAQPVMTFVVVSPDGRFGASEPLPEGG